MTTQESGKLLEALSKELSALCAIFAQENNVTFVRTRGSYNSNEFSTTVKFITIDSAIGVTSQISDKFALSLGKATIGGIYFAQDKSRDLYYKVRILGSLKKNYLIEFVDFPEEGRYRMSYGMIKNREDVPTDLIFE
jgi:hypothetical protein